MERGNRVIAKVMFEESDFDGEGIHTHARPGDVGEIVDVFESGLMVRWLETGTACDATADEVSAEDQRVGLAS
jgi:hypothetical protein